MVMKTWEPRVGKLLNDLYFVWSYKAPDSPRYGGQPRVDYIACDIYGTFWMVEVKQLAVDRKSINIQRELTAGQQSALEAIHDVCGSALLAVGRGDTLYVFTWGRVKWLLEQLPDSLIPLEEATLILQWKGPKAWTMANNLRRFHRCASTLPMAKLRGELLQYGIGQGTETQLTPSSDKPESSPSISKLTGYTPTVEEMARVGLVP